MKVFADGHRKRPSVQGFRRDAEVMPTALSVSFLHASHHPQWNAFLSFKGMIHVFYAPYYQGKLTNFHFHFFLQKVYLSVKWYYLLHTTLEKCITYQNDHLKKLHPISMPSVVCKFLRWSKFEREI
jgi:hypothetical protein